MARTKFNRRPAVKSNIPEHVWRLAERDQLRREVLRLKAIGRIVPAATGVITDAK